MANNKKNIFILGCGFGLALSILWDKAGHNVTCYSKFPEEIELIKREGEHKKLLPGVGVPDTIELTSDITKARDKDIVVFVVPSKFLSDAVLEVSPYISDNAIVVNMGKGFCESDGGILRLSEVVEKSLSTKTSPPPVVVITGPCHAEEVGRGFPTTVVASCNHKESAEYVQSVLQTETLRIYVNDDVKGTELGGALKNPIALCCGIASGMGLGDNAAAALMTRGLAEIKRLGTALGAKWQTFTGLAGVGDLIVTCTSRHSRNYRAGYLIGSGKTVSEAIGETGTVEGYDCVRVAVKLGGENNVDLPIFGILYKICYENLSPSDALCILMERPQRNERELFW